MSGMTEDRAPGGEPLAERLVRIAAVGDLHFDPSGRGGFADIFTRASREAEVLALCGDLTTHGRLEQMQAFVDELAAVEVPIVAVLGNHDFEGDDPSLLAEVLRDRGVTVLDGTAAVIHGVGFVGTKGFAGGFGRGALAPFGEPLIKAFVQASIDESLKLENALRTMTAPTRVVLMHYSPITATLEGEPEYIYPFLGSSRLLEPLETYGATVIFHGHAHNGTPEGRTPQGIPVFNVALPLLRKHGMDYRVWEVRAPERRGAAQQGGGRGGGQAGGQAAD
ncbi:MAG TPA: metallophosphoesterase [Longimicrobiales bacterium]|nr:metallophosphoesterase [Longimicrobiales bacterium]